MKTFTPLRLIVLTNAIAMAVGTAQAQYHTGTAHSGHSNFGSYQHATDSSDHRPSIRYTPPTPSVLRPASTVTSRPSPGTGTRASSVASRPIQPAYLTPRTTPPTTLGVIAEYRAAQARSRAGFDCTLSQSAGRMSCYEQRNMEAPACYEGQRRTNDSVYTGSGTGRNNPAMQSTPNVGPIPQGTWNATGVQRTLTNASGRTSSHANVIRLEPTADTNTFGRTAFRMHGDNSTGTASLGCPIAPPATRSTLANMIRNGGQMRLTVTR